MSIDDEFEVSDICVSFCSFQVGNAKCYTFIINLLCGDLKSVPIPQCIYSESLYQIQIAALLYILHFSPGNVVGVPIVQGPGALENRMDGIGGMDGMGEVGMGFDERTIGDGSSVFGNSK